MMECFENKIYFINYKEKYFFSNNKEVAQEKMLLEIEKEVSRGKEKKKNKTNSNYKIEMEETLQKVDKVKNRDRNVR